MLRDDQMCDVFKITKKILKTCQDITGEQCLRNDDSVLVVGDEDMEKLSCEAFKHIVCMG